MKKTAAKSVAADLKRIFWKWMQPLQYLDTLQSTLWFLFFQIHWISQRHFLYFQALDVKFFHWIVLGEKIWRSDKFRVLSWTSLTKIIAGKVWMLLNDKFRCSSCGTSSNTPGLVKGMLLLTIVISVGRLVGVRTPKKRLPDSESGSPDSESRTASPFSERLGVRRTPRLAVLLAGLSVFWSYPFKQTVWHKKLDFFSIYTWKKFWISSQSAGKEYCNNCWCVTGIDWTKENFIEKNAEIQ